MASCCEVTNVTKAQPVSLLPRPDLMGKRINFTFQEGENPLRVKRKPALVFWELPMQGHGLCTA